MKHWNALVIVGALASIGVVSCSREQHSQVSTERAQEDPNSSPFASEAEMADLPPHWRAELLWPTQTQIENNRMPLDQKLVKKAVDDTMRYLAMVLQDKWVPNRSDVDILPLKSSLEGCDAVWLRYERGDYAIQVVSTSAQIAVAIRDRKTVSKDEINQSRAKKHVSSMLDKFFRESEKIQRISMNRVKETKTGVFGYPTIAGPMADYWWGLVSWWTNGNTILIGTGKYDGGPWSPDLEKDWFSKKVAPPPQNDREITKAVDELAEYRGMEDPEELIDRIAAVGDKAVTHLIQRFEKKENDNLVVCLCKIGTDRSLAYVRRLLDKHQSQDPRLTVIRNYPAAKEDDILPALVDIVTGPQDYVRYKAEERLECMIKRKPSRAGALVAALKDDGPRDDGNFTTYEILASVSGYNHTWGFVPPGEDGAAYRRKFWRDWWARNKDKDRFGWLEEAVTSSPDSEPRQCEALGSMASLRDKRAVPYLLKALDSPSDKIKFYAVQGLRYLDSGVPDTKYTYEMFVKEKAKVIPALRQQFSGTTENMKGRN
jgi:hypothetical protein